MKPPTSYLYIHFLILVMYFSILISLRQDQIYILGALLHVFCFVTFGVYINKEKKIKK